MAPFSSDKSSPLPSYTPPRVHSSTFLSSLADSPPNPSFSEKVSLSYIKRYPSPGRLAFLKQMFVPLRLNVPAGGFRGRVVTVPVLWFLHPGRDIRGGHRQSRHESVPSSSVFRVYIAVLGTVGSLLVAALLVLSILRPLIPLLPSRHSLPFTEPNTSILSASEVERVWLWEIASGHYPSRRPPDFPTLQIIGNQSPSTSIPSKRIENPGLPRQTEEERRQELAVQAEVKRRIPEDSFSLPQIPPLFTGTGPPRKYIPVRARSPFSMSSLQEPPSPYPPRPTLNSVLDTDAVMDHCDFSEKKYVRDCLEVLRMNGGLDQGVRRGDADAWKMTFMMSNGAEHGTQGHKSLAWAESQLEQVSGNMTKVLNSSSFEMLLNTRQQLTLAKAFSATGNHAPHPSHPTADRACDPQHPRIFHIFWAGPFTDKPYSAALSFLYTQRLNLDQSLNSIPSPGVCRPQLWIWINPGPASSVPDIHARNKMRKDLASNPWSAPLLHPRFHESVKFKLWNTTEQLDDVSELQGWREAKKLFNSGGVTYGEDSAFDKVSDPQSADSLQQSDTREDKVVDAEAELDPDSHPAEAALSQDRAVAANTTAMANATAVLAPLPPKAKDELFERVGSSANKYDRLSVVLSDMARFVLTHRFGGVYLDADTIFLRDWEELWGWHGAFAYRWSRMKKYNTAVLKMQRRSAIGNLIFRTAVKNGFDFHPMTVSRYTKDAQVEGLLLRMPDALFDPAWLNTEYYQRDRPPFPYFKRFEDFFETPKDMDAAPVSIGFDGFFKGAFSYHFHNFWWIPFDPSRNFPDLGHRFEKGERLARGRLLVAKLAAQPPSKASDSHVADGAPSPTLPLSSGPSIATGTKSRSQKALNGQAVSPKWGDDESDFDSLDWDMESVEEDERDLSWSAVLKRTFESYIRGERPNMYGEWINWDLVEVDEDGEI